MALAPALVYTLIGALWSGALRPARLAAGLIGGSAMVLTGTYARFGLSLMADVPAVFWSVLGVTCVLRAWPPDAAMSVAPATARRWALAAGLALGVAVLVRY